MSVTTIKVLSHQRPVCHSCIAFAGDAAVRRGAAAAACDALAGAGSAGLLLRGRHRRLLRRPGGHRAKVKLDSSVAQHAAAASHGGMACRVELHSRPPHLPSGFVAQVASASLPQPSSPCVSAPPGTTSPARARSRWAATAGRCVASRGCPSGGCWCPPAGTPPSSCGTRASAAVRLLCCTLSSRESSSCPPHDEAPPGADGRPDAHAPGHQVTGRTCIMCHAFFVRHDAMRGCLCYRHVVLAFICRPCVCGGRAAARQGIHDVGGKAAPGGGHLGAPRAHIRRAEVSTIFAGGLNAQLCRMFAASGTSAKPWAAAQTPPEASWPSMFSKPLKPTLSCQSSTLSHRLQKCKQIRRAVNAAWRAGGRSSTGSRRSSTRRGACCCLIVRFR